MMRSGTLLLTASLLIGTLCGCEATAEDIERWKGTQRGPAKITAVVVDSRYPSELRARAAVALVEIVQWDHFNAAFQQMAEQDRQEIVHDMVPLLVEMYARGAAEATPEGPTDPQVNAKDAMIDIYEWASPQDQRLLLDPLVEWITSDFNAHYLPGRRSIAIIVEKVGPPAATALARILTPKNTLVAAKVSELIAEHGNDESKRVASEELAKTGKALGDRIRADMWKAMATICGEPIRRFTLSYAARHEGNVESQQNGLICVMTGGVADCGHGCTRPEDIDSLFQIAEDEQQDERIRAAAYDAIREHGSAANVDRLLKMIDDPDARYKATGIDIAVHLGGAKVVIDALERIGSSRERWPWKLKNSRTNHQEYGVCNMGLGLLEQAKGVHDVLLKALGHENAFVRGGAANMLGIVGSAEDIPRLEKLTSDRARLKGWEPDNVGAHAQQAIERIRDSKRPSDVSARRGKACGL